MPRPETTAATALRGRGEVGPPPSSSEAAEDIECDVEAATVVHAVGSALDLPSSNRVRYPESILDRRQIASVRRGSLSSPCLSRFRADAVITGAGGSPDRSMHADELRPERQGLSACRRVLVALICGRLQVLVDEPDADGAFTGAGGDALDRALADVSDREDSREVGFEQQGARPSPGLESLDALSEAGPLVVTAWDATRIAPR